jgi:HlyD family secretion protein
VNRRNVLTFLGIALIAAAVIAANLWFKRETGVTVTTEVIKLRDLEAIVSASGKIQPKRSVNISADTSGRVVELAVDEGDRVSKGQFLLLIDPRSLRTRVDSGTASLRVAEASLEQLRQSVETARVQLEQARLNLARQQDLWRDQLTTREALEKAQNEFKSAQSLLQEREKQIKPQENRIAQERAALESARYDLTKVRIESPIDGIVTRRSIQEGETAVIGTMNNAGTVLLTLADMSVIQAEVEVDETSIPSIQVGQVAKISVDAIPDQTFKGHVTEIGNSPVQAANAQQQAGTQATNFKVVVLLDEPIPDDRPGFSCTADITTATRRDVVAAPIPAVAVRELVFNEEGQIVKEPQIERRRRRRVTSSTAAPAELQPGQTRKEVEGVFAVHQGLARFVPIKVGIAGDRYFEVLSGLKPGDQVITGPYNSVRGMADGDPVRIDNRRGQRR